MRAEGHTLVPVLLLAGDTHGPVVGARRQDDAAGTQRSAALDVDCDQSVLARRVQRRGLHPRGDVHVVGADVLLQGGPEPRTLGVGHRDEVLDGHGVEDLPAESRGDQAGAQRLAGGVDGCRRPRGAAPDDQDLERVLRVKGLGDARTGPGIEAGDEVRDIHATLAEQLPVLVDRGDRLDAERLHLVLEGAALDRHVTDPRVDDAHGVEGLNHGRAVLARQGHVGDEFSPLEPAHRLGGLLVQAGGVAANLDQGEHQ